MRTRSHPQWLMPLSLLVLLALAAAEAAPAFAQASQTVFDTLPERYKNQSDQWFRPLLEIARSLFWKLALIEFAWSAIVWALQEDHLKSFTAHVVKKLIFIGFMYFLLGSADDLLPAIVRGLASAGMTAGGAASVSGWYFSPSFLFDSGIDIANELIKAIMRARAWDDTPTALLGGAVALMIVVSLLVVAAQLLIVMIEGYVAMFGGVLFLGFGGSRWTVEFTQKVLTYALAVGVKLFVIYLLVAVVSSEIDQWKMVFVNSDETDNPVTWTKMFSVLGNAMFFAFVVYQVPRMAARMIAGAPLRTHVEEPRAVAVTDGGSGYRPPPSTTVIDSARGGMAVVMESLRHGSGAVRDAYDHHRESGSGTVVAAIKAIGASTVDYRPARGPSDAAAQSTAANTSASSAAADLADLADAQQAQARRTRSARTPATPSHAGSLDEDPATPTRQTHARTQAAHALPSLSGTRTTRDAAYSALADAQADAAAHAGDDAHVSRAADAPASASIAPHDETVRRPMPPGFATRAAATPPSLGTVGNTTAINRSPVMSSADASAASAYEPADGGSVPLASGPSHASTASTARHAETGHDASGAGMRTVPPPAHAADGHRTDMTSAHGHATGTPVRTTQVATTRIRTTPVQTTSVQTTPVQTTPATAAPASPGTVDSPGAPGGPTSGSPVKPPRK